ncbi:hypothetical protein [Streptomyces nigra]|uniref:hypothetical protein n=1 Tax=Streptomyces nigra TaxID=1827580 RepID=UPI0035DD0839
MRSSAGASRWTARYWAPMLDPASAADLYPSGPETALRLRTLADSYDLSAKDRTELPTVIERATEGCRAFVTRRVTDGDPVYLKAPADRGGWARWGRLQTWLTDHREEFTAALLI